MGNKALRTKLAGLIGRRLYAGSKFAAYRYLRARTLRRLITQAEAQVGTVVHDCDGFNHRVVASELLTRFISQRSWRKSTPDRYLGWVVNSIDLTFEDGGYCCGCGGGGGPAVPRDLIETWTFGWILGHREAGTGWANSPYHDEVLRRLMNAEHVCGEDGILLPELRELSRSPTKEQA